MKARLSVTIIALILSLPTVVHAQVIQNFKPYDQAGIGVFEPEKDDTPFDGVQVRWGAAFTQQMQMLSHSNAADAVLDAEGRNVNELYNLAYGFNLATANLVLDAQLADGIRVNLTTYLSSRHHNEAWVKGGYLQIDKLDFLDVEALTSMMDYLSIRVGHFGLNYGDAHYRRTDNGHALHNPFVGNYIMDALATEIGGEVLFRHQGVLAMLGVSSGENQGNLRSTGNKRPSFVGKLGYDNWVSPDLRVRLTGSVYHTGGSDRNTLYNGDRAGSRYYLVLENEAATAAANFRSGRVSPDITDRITATMINPYLRYQGLELFGLFEFVSGRSHGEVDNRTWRQIGGEALYRFLPQEQLYVGARFAQVNGELIGSGRDVTIQRLQLGGGWFITPNMLLKAEYVNQSYDGYASSSIFHEGRFDGVLVEAVVSF